MCFSIIVFIVIVMRTSRRVKVSLALTVPPKSTLVVGTIIAILIGLFYCYYLWRSGRSEFKGAAILKATYMWIGIILGIIFGIVVIFQNQDFSIRGILMHSYLLLPLLISIQDLLRLTVFRPKPY